MFHVIDNYMLKWMILVLIGNYFGQQQLSYPTFVALNERFKLFYVIGFATQ